VELNENQNQAVYSQTKQTLILAGAGTGKTRVIINRIVNLIKQGIPAHKIVSTTFTNKAAAELRHRLSAEIGPLSQEILCGTFHKLSAILLRKYGNLINIQTNFQILTDDDARKLIKRILKEQEKEAKVYTILEQISNHKENNTIIKDQTLKKIIDEYESELVKNNYLDYSDLIKNAILLFKTNPEITKEIAEHILIDEYQDINNAQYQWIKLISADKYLFCVGDEDQAIYSFRGSNIEYIQKFQQDFPEANIIKLEENYRSAEAILKGAQNLIDKNTKIFKKTLIAADKTKIGNITATKVYNEFDEARMIAKIITKWKGQNPNYKIAILIRTNLQVYVIEQALVEAQIPYNITGSKKFYAKKEIQDLVSYLKVLAYPHDFIAFSRIINSPKRSIGDSRLQMLLQAMKSLDTNFENALTTLLPQLPKRAAEKCKILLMQIHNWRLLLNHTTLDTIIEKIITDTGYKNQEDFGKLQEQSIEVLKENLKKTTSLTDFLENLHFSEEENAEDEVQVMTMHGAKGLEFDIVISPGWEENMFPSGLSKTKFDIEEERRLAYVTITRARLNLEILYAMSRKINGKYTNQMPSRFLFEIK